MPSEVRKFEKARAFTVHPASAYAYACSCNLKEKRTNVEVEVRGKIKDE